MAVKVKGTIVIGAVLQSVLQPVLSRVIGPGDAAQPPVVLNPVITLTDPNPVTDSDTSGSEPFTLIADVLFPPGQSIQSAQWYQIDGGAELPISTQLGGGGGPPPPGQFRFVSNQERLASSRTDYIFRVETLEGGMASASISVTVIAGPPLREAGTVTPVGDWELVASDGFERPENAVNGVDDAPADIARHDTEGLADSEFAFLERRTTYANPIPAGARDIAIDTAAIIQTRSQITGAVGTGSLTERITEINGVVLNTPIVLYSYSNPGGNIAVPADADITAELLPFLTPGVPLVITTRIESQLDQLFLAMASTVEDAAALPFDVSYLPAANPYEDLEPETVEIYPLSADAVAGTLYQLSPTPSNSNTTEYAYYAGTFDGAVTRDSWVLLDANREPVETQWLEYKSSAAQANWTTRYANLDFRIIYNGEERNVKNFVSATFDTSAEQGQFSLYLQPRYGYNQIDTRVYQIVSGAGDLDDVDLAAFNGLTGAESWMLLSGLTGDFDLQPIDDEKWTYVWIYKMRGSLSQQPLVQDETLFYRFYSNDEASGWTRTLFDIRGKSNLTELDCTDNKGKLSGEMVKWDASNTELKRLSIGLNDWTIEPTSDPSLHDPRTLANLEYLEARDLTLDKYLPVDGLQELNYVDQSGTNVLDVEGSGLLIQNNPKLRDFYLSDSFHRVFNNGVAFDVPSLRIFVLQRDGCENVDALSGQSYPNCIRFWLESHDLTAQVPEFSLPSVTDMRITSLYRSGVRHGIPPAIIDSHTTGANRYHLQSNYDTGSDYSDLTAALRRANDRKVAASQPAISFIDLRGNGAPSPAAQADIDYMVGQGSSIFHD